MTDDSLRVNAYTLLAACQLAAPAEQLLTQLAALAPAAQDEPGQTLARLAAAATAADEAISDDYHQLFIGLGRGKVVPYASYYLTGNMMDMPLANLRRDLAALGIHRREGVGEPEDHGGALCESMAMLCAQESAESFAQQKKFFDAHLAGWMEALFTDIAGAADSEFYCALGDFGAAFMRFEKRYFGMMF